MNPARAHDPGAPRERAKKAILESPEASTAVLAERARCSEPTVLAARADLGIAGPTRGPIFAKKIAAVLETNPAATTRAIAAAIGCSSATVVNTMHALGIVRRAARNDNSEAVPSVSTPMAAEPAPARIKPSVGRRRRAERPLAEKRARDAERAALLAALDPSSITRLPSGIVDRHDLGDDEEVTIAVAIPDSESDRRFRERARAGRLHTAKVDQMLGRYDDYRSASDSSGDDTIVGVHAAAEYVDIPEVTATSLRTHRCAIAFTWNNGKRQYTREALDAYRLQHYRFSLDTQDEPNENHVDPATYEPTDDAGEI